MRYFDQLVNELKRAKESLISLKQREQKPFIYSDEKRWITWEKERIKRLIIEYEGYAPQDLQLILIDAQQALVFSEKENPEDHWQEVLKSPFEVFWLEFSEPIALNSPEPSSSEMVFGTHDLVHAICYRSLKQDEMFYTITDGGTVGENANQTIAGGIGANSTTRHGHLDQLYELDPSTIENDEYAYITMLCETDGRTGDAIKQHGESAQPDDILSPRTNNLERITRSFLYHVKTGTVRTRVEPITDFFNDPSQLPEDFPFKNINAGESLGIENRYIGWWERALLTYSSLSSWMLLYLMAKGIEIVEEPLTRSEKRRKQRDAEKNKQEESPYPKDWHVIQSKPRFSNGNSKGSGSGSPNRFRYDVMGFFRTGRHKLKNGTWKSTPEWVPAHQRGLAHTLYIPSVRKAESDKKSDERNYEYFRKPGELP